jgi:DNA-binding transcriptional regulator YiaG
VSRIRQIREERAELVPAVFPQTAVSARVGVSVNAVRAWELDRARPRKATAKRLLQALGDQVDQLGLDDAATDTRHDGHIVKEPA